MMKINIYMTVIGAAMIVLGARPAFAQDPLTNIGFDQQFVDSIAKALPETRAVDNAFLNPSYNPNIRISEDANLAVTFIDEGAGYRNSLGYFTFADDTFADISFGQIDTNNTGHISVDELTALGGVSTGLIFDNVSERNSGGSLRTGDTTVLGGGTASLANDGSLLMEGGIKFDEGTNVGFFLAQNAYSNGGVKGYNKGGDPLIMYTVDFLNPENNDTAVLGSAAENSRHTAMMFADNSQSEIVIGFEDLHRSRGSDDDFNDAIFIVQSNPIAAISNVNIATVGDKPISAAPVPIGGAGPMGLIGFAGFMAWRRRRVS